MLSVGELTVNIFLPRGIIGLLYKKEELMNLNATH